VIWSKAPLGEVCEKITDGAHSSPPTVSSEFRMASVKDMTRFGIMLETCRTISKEAYCELQRSGCCPQIGDVLIAKDGATALDTVCQVREEPNYVLLSSVAILRPGPKIRSGYLRYWLDSKDTRKYLKESFRSGSAIPRVVLKDFRRAQIPVPPVEIQDRIIFILEALDDKIELNRKMNETLEHMARAIFKSWFIDFDPVHAKASGARPFGMDNATAALFPGGFEKSEIGEIPKGWSYSPLGEFVELVRGTTYKSALKGLQGPYLLGLGSIERNGGFRDEKLTTYGGDSPEKLLLKSGDIFVSLKDVTQSADLLGAVARVPKHILLGRLTQDTVKLEFKSNRPIKEIVFRTLLSPQYRDYCRAHATGTTNLGLAREDFLSYPILEIPDSILCCFNSLIEPLNELLEKNVIESQWLSETRDLLLPRFLSGEIKIKEVS
jgi:type I restriction enzyme, S subunit